MSKKKNALFSFHPGLLSGRQQRARGRTPYNRRVAGMVRKARGKGAPSNSVTAIRADVIEALVGQGYKRADARKAVAGATGSDFASLFRNAIKRNPRQFYALSDESTAALLKLLEKKEAMAMKKRKEKTTRRPRRRANTKVQNYRRRVTSTRRRKTHTKARPRVRKATFPIAIPESAHKKVQSFLSKVTGRKVKLGFFGK